MIPTRTKRTPLSHKEHLWVADRLAVASYCLSQIAELCTARYLRGHYLIKYLARVRSYLWKLEDTLNDEYVRVSTSKELEAHGFIYENLDARAQRVLKKSRVPSI